MCRACGTVQKRISEAWLAEIREIYNKYFAYHQADGDEQVVFDARTAEVRPRSDVLLERVAENLDLPPVGATLDIGCGTGGTIASLSRRYPTYHLYGHDLDERNKSRLQSIPNFAALYTGPVADVPGRFDLITLIHSLEHFPEPLAVLQSVRDKLKDGGFLLVEVCDALRNPFDLLVADHMMHFSARSLRFIVESAGFSVSVMANDWIIKELSAVARRAEAKRGLVGTVQDLDRITDAISRNLEWLLRIVEVAQAAVDASGKIGVFGTSISGTWLADRIRGRFDYFVDEDPMRVGRQHMGKPIFSPVQLPVGSAVFLALVPELAQVIAKRLAHLPLVFIHPPPL